MLKHFDCHSSLVNVSCYVIADTFLKLKTNEQSNKAFLLASNLFSPSCCLPLSWVYVQFIIMRKNARYHSSKKFVWKWKQMDTVIRSCKCWDQNQEGACPTTVSLPIYTCIRLWNHSLVQKNVYKNTVQMDVFET